MNRSDKDASDKLVPLAREIVDSCIEFAGVLKFDKKHPQHLYSVCTYGSILEIATGINALIASGQITSVPILLRTLLDAYASFRCCIVDPNHFKAMCASFLKEKRRLLSSIASNPENPYLKKIAETMDVKATIDELSKELHGIKGQGYEPLAPWAEFQKAELQAEYQSLYWQLCMHAHNDISALEDRHLERKDGDYEVAFFKDAEPDDVIRYVDSTCGLVLDASTRLHSLLETGEDDKLKVLHGKLQEIRALYADAPQAPPAPSSK